MVNIGRKEAVFFAAVLLAFLVAGFGVAYGGNNPAVMGHTAGEIEGVCLSDGTNCPLSMSSGGTSLPTDCGAGAILKWGGSEWICGTDNVGTGSGSVSGNDVTVLYKGSSISLQEFVNTVSPYVPASDKYFVSPTTNGGFGVGGDGGFTNYDRANGDRYCNFLKEGYRMADTEIEFDDCFEEGICEEDQEFWYHNEHEHVNQKLVTCYSWTIGDAVVGENHYYGYTKILGGIVNKRECDYLARVLCVKKD